jgi:hypothetical protein
MTEYLWNPLTPDEVASVFESLGIQWWVAGGLAIDLFVCHATRDHGDIDVAMLRRDLPAVRPLLGSWDICIAHDGHLTPWNGELIAPEYHQFWARLRGEDAWAFEVLLEVTENDDWIYRRDERIRRPIKEIGRTTPNGLPYLAPEICLLYKSPRGFEVERNSADFDTALPLMDSVARDWLKTAFAVIDPQHPWLSRL